MKTNDLNLLRSWTAPRRGLPWRIGNASVYQVATATGAHLFHVDCIGAQEVVEHVLRSVNAHDELVAALRAMIAAGEYHYAQSGWPSQFHAGALDAARAALARAEGAS